MLAHTRFTIFVRPEISTIDKSVLLMRIISYTIKEWTKNVILYANVVAATPMVRSYLSYLEVTM